MIKELKEKNLLRLIIFLVLDNFWIRVHNLIMIMFFYMILFTLLYDSMNYLLESLVYLF